jgi:propionate CoA-transferase
MDAALFRPGLLGLRDRAPLTLEERLSYDAVDNVAYVNFEGLRLMTVADAMELADHLDRWFTGLGRKVNVVVNYDNFVLSTEAADRFFTMIRHNTARYFLSSTRYSTNAFLRRQVGRRFQQARLEQRIYADFGEASARTAQAGQDGTTQ